MPLPAALLACALNVSPVTLEAIIRTESGGNALALNVNRLPGPQPRAADAAEAVRLAAFYVAQGYSVDLGLMQVNTLNLPRLGLTIAQALDPCTNIAAGARILREGYAAAVGAQPDPQQALRVAFSRYNTGHPERGFANGYVARVQAAAEIVVPAIALRNMPSPAVAPAPQSPSMPPRLAGGTLFERAGGPPSAEPGGDAPRLFLRHGG